MDGVADLAVNDITNQTEFYTLFPTSGSVAPGDSLEVQITFSPQTVQIYSDTIMIFTDDPYNPVNTLILQVPPLMNLQILL